MKELKADGDVRSGIDYDLFMDMREQDVPFAYSERDAMLYALAIGMGRDPVDERELKFVYEGRGFVAMPSLGVVVTRSDLPRTLPINYNKVLHVEQSLQIHDTMPTSANLLADTRIVSIVDKGADKGALIYHETIARDAVTQKKLFTVGGTLLARGDGGFGGLSTPVAERYECPERTPDLRHVTETRADQALLYRLTGDRNPLHCDPAYARRAGFEAPILHGLCTYGVACRAIIAEVCEYDPARLQSLDVRFTSPVLPGDRIETDIWVDGSTVSFRCRVPERGVVVLDDGRAIVSA